MGKVEAIALEGPVCAGKTTIINDMLTFGYKKVPEYVDYALDNFLSLPKFPPKNETEAKANFEFYLDLELRRQRGIAMGVWLLDRSKYTLLAFEAGARYLTQIDIFGWACNLVDQRKAEIIEPNKVLYIDLPPNESKRRADVAGMGTPEFLFSPKFTDGFKGAFEVFASNSEKFTFLDGNKPYADVLIVVSRMILSSAGINPTPASI